MTMLNFELITPINGELTDADDLQIQTCIVFGEDIKLPFFAF